ncbi:ParA family protein [Candidatus Entotheonella palauensis]|uniref:ParA family protein n=1 Tax=Candidatus Entotheonella palauensis TaxID=93172 RepID=UPI000B7CF677|nr:division plane positioning ATPase MipZ [Candidatus Entotheonella palauensis]
MNVVIADCREKSGKTTLALHLSVALAEAGSNVLLADADPEGSLDTLQSLSETGKILDRQGLQMLRYTSIDRLQVVTGLGRRLAFAGLPDDPSQRESCLPPDLASAYDWVIFDTSCANRSITAYIVGLSDRILAPLQVEPESFRSVPETLNFFLAEQQTRSALKFEGFVHQRLRPIDTLDSDAQAEAEATLTAICREFPKICLDVEIPFDDTLNTDAAQEPMVISTPGIQAAFSALAQEFTARVDGGTRPQATPRIEEPPSVASRRRSWWRRLFG